MDFSDKDNTLRLGMELSHQSLSYADSCGHEPLTVTLKVTNDGAEALKKFSIRFNTSSEFLHNVFENVVTGSVGAKDSSRSEFSVNQSFSLNPVAFRGLNEEVEESITAILLDSEGEIVTMATSVVTLRAMDYWNGRYRTLPVFVERNCDAVKDLHTLVNDALRKITGQDGLCAYQRGKDYAKAQFAAIYSVLQEQGLVYSEPLQSDYTKGQRIRSAEEILRHKSATCLDSTLLFCSIAESFGLHPLICMLETHAFPGIWLTEDDEFDSVVHDDPSSIVSNSGPVNQRIAIVESTMVTKVPLVSFEDASMAAFKKAEAADVMEIIDVHTARTMGVRPLPSKTVSPEGEITYVEDPEFTHMGNTPERIIDFSLDDYGEVDNRPKTKTEAWERKLLNLSARNPLLSVKVRTNSVQVLHPDLSVLEDLISSGKRLVLSPKPDDAIAFDLSTESLVREHSLVLSSMAGKNRLATGETAETLPKKLSAISRKAQSEQSETGVNPLFLAMGLIEWNDGGATSYTAPILLYPVNLEKKGRNEFSITLRDGEEPQVNYSIFEKMATEFNMTVSLDYDNLPTDENGLDVRRIFAIVKKDIEKARRWRVVENCVLGLFSFDMFVMWSDMHRHSDLLSRNKVVDSLIKGEVTFQDEIPSSLSDSDSIEELVPVSCDESQMLAVKAAAGGHSFILQGPPGTGKSQTITAMITNALAHGKKVLFVAEKMAALQVVYRNLSKVNASEFLLEMHSTKINKTRLVEQLSKAVERQKLEETNTRPEEKRLSEMEKELSTYVEALHRKGESGLSLYSLIDRYEPWRGMDYDQIEFSVLSGVSLEDIEDLRTRLIDISRRLTRFMPVASSPFRFVGVKGLPLEKQKKVKELLEETLSSYAKAEAKTKAFYAALGVDKDNIPLTSREKLMAVFATARVVAKNRLLAESYLGMDAERLFQTQETLMKLKLARLKAFNALGEKWNPRVLELDIPGMLQEWATIKDGIFKGRQRKEFVARVSSYATEPIAMEKVEEELRLLNAAGQDFRKLEEARNNVVAFLGSLDAENNLDATLALLADVMTLRDEAEAALRSLWLPHQNDDIARAVKAWVQYPETVGDVVKALDAIATPREKLEKILSLQKSARNLSAKDSVALFQEYGKRMNDLVEWSEINTMRAFFDHKAYAGKALEAVVSSASTGEEAYSRLYRSFLKTEIDMILYTTPELRRYTKATYGEMVEELDKVETEWRSHVKDEVRSRIDKVVRERKKDPEQARNVNHFIAKGGKKRTIRSLFDTSLEYISDICPCFLMSPLSVSQYVAAGKDVFDLVIFDEASQIMTSKAVGAISRGKDLIVVGDSKQMPPTSFFLKSLENGEEGSWNPEDDRMGDLDSILDDCVALGLPELSLKWHYRSTNESLIQFSNTHYYDSSLKTYPSTDPLTSKVLFRKVEGFYQVGSKEPNPAEAEAIVDEIARRLSSPVTDKDSIGVITFNEKQQALVISKLDALFERRPDLAKKAHWDQNEIDCPDKLIVKNLENIQGDERDVIMLSVTFGKTQSGRFIKNFGPIGLSGGEKRLNVAFSRSRKLMLVFSIISTMEFRSAALSSRGANDLRAFLEYAQDNTAEALSSDKASNLAETISDRLEKEGYRVEKNVGRSEFKIDIAVGHKDSDEFFSAILLDGEAMTSATLSYDRFLLRERMLSGRGWNVILLRSIDYLENPEETLDYVASEVKREEEEWMRRQEESTVEELPEVPEEKGDDALLTRYAGIYAKCVLEMDDLSGAVSLDKVDVSLLEDKVRKVVEAEGPVVDDVLHTRIMTSFGIKRRTVGVRKTLEGVIDGLSLVSTTQTDPAGSEHLVFWPERFREGAENLEAGYIQYRLPPSGTEEGDLLYYRRTIGEYPHIEIRNLMANEVQHSSWEKNSLLVRVREKLGFKTSGSEIVAVLEKVLGDGIDSGFFLEEMGRITLA